MSQSVIFEMGGPDLTIQVDGIRYVFEMHPVCGPAEDEQDTYPESFWTAVSHWAEQGRRMEDGLCRWDHPPEMITRHLGGKHYKVVGYTEPRRGE